MREIWFRGKTKQGEWVEGSYVYAHKWFGTGEAGHFITSIYGSNRVLVMPETVGQYTGLKDKNGVKIYEGDIVNFTRGLYGYPSTYFTYPCEVNYRVSKFGYSGFLPFDTSDMIECEVIGNVTDNPELLKE